MFKEYFTPYLGVSTFETNGSHAVYHTCWYNDNIKDYFKSSTDFINTFGHLLDISSFHKEEMKKLEISEIQEYLLDLAKLQSNTERLRFKYKCELEFIKDLDDFIYSNIPPLRHNDNYKLLLIGDYGQGTVWEETINAHGNNIVYLLLMSNMINSSTVDHLQNRNASVTFDISELDNRYVIEVKVTFSDSAFPMKHHGRTISSPHTFALLFDKELNDL